MTLTKTAAIGIALGIVALILLPVNLHLNYIPYFDKFAHMAACGIATLALANIVSIRKAVLIVFIAATAAEWLQFYIPHRGPSMGDFIANTVGILGAWLLYLTYYYYGFISAMREKGYSVRQTVHAVKFFKQYQNRNSG